MEDAGPWAEACRIYRDLYISGFTQLLYFLDTDCNSRARRGLYYYLNILNFLLFVFHPEKLTLCACLTLSHYAFPPTVTTRARPVLEML